MNCYKILSVSLLVLQTSKVFSQPVDFVRYVSDSVIQIDETISQVCLLFEINEGLHIQSNNPKSDTVIPTRITLDTPEGITPGEPVFPQAETVYLEGSKEPLQVFSGRLKVVVPISYSKVIDQPRGIPGTIYYQACDDKRCFYPRELVFKVNLIH